MATTWVPYQNFIKNQVDGSLVTDWDTDSIKISFHTVTYVPSATADNDFADVTNEVTGDGYTAGGNTLTASVTGPTGNNVTLDASNTTWSEGASGFTDARIAVCYKDTGTAGTSPLIAYNDLGASKSNDDGDLTFDLSDGIVEFQH